MLTDIGSSARETARSVDYTGGRLRTSGEGVGKATSVQQPIAAPILGTLYEKVEPNRRMSETLEAMARALFKSWFVDFDAARDATCFCLDPAFGRITI